MPHYSVQLELIQKIHHPAYLTQTSKAPPTPELLSNQSYQVPILPTSYASVTEICNQTSPKTP